MKRPAHWYYYRAMLRRLMISIMLGIMSAVIVWLFHQAMLGLEWVLFARTDGSLVAAASSINLATGNNTRFRWLGRRLIIVDVSALSASKTQRPYRLYGSH